MRILVIEWGGYGSRDLREAWMEEGHELYVFPFEVSGAFPYGKYVEDQDVEERLHAVLREEALDFVFSINYFPVISGVCRKEKIRYVSWNYDCPHRLLYSPTIRNACNQVYVFDKTVCQEFRREGVRNMDYLPLATNTARLDRIGNTEDGLFLPFLYDVSFVGTLYLERTDGVFDKINECLSDYAKGYLKALCAVSLKIYGCDLTETMSAAVLNEMYQIYPLSSEPFFKESRAHIYGDMIKQRLTAIERIDLLEAVGAEYGVDLFTHIVDFPLQNVRNHGAVGYYEEMPLVFKQSRVNLNITLRNIKSGIPLRAFDIMGSGGFLLSNYQADFLEHFVPGEDFICYEGREDLIKKAGYYLSHDEERAAIARNGHDKVAAGHTYRHRVQEMLQNI